MLPLKFYSYETQGSIFSFWLAEAFSNLVGRVIEIGPDLQKLKQTPIDGMIHTVSESEVVKGTFLTRRKTLDDIPSPYLTGFLDKFFDGVLSPMLETNRGCPFSCSFCNTGDKYFQKSNMFQRR